MLVTIDLLKQYNARQEGIEYMQRVYPAGAEVIDIIRDKNIPKEMLHWGREHLTHSAQELEEYCKACNIINSKGYWYSVDVRDSKNVVKSRDVNASERIFNSSEVNYSFDVVGSDFVGDSEQVYASSMVDNCAMVLESENVSNSKNICFSTTVAKSANILNSQDVWESSEIIISKNVTNSHFCSSCENISNCLFCDGLSNAEYHIFNKPVDKARFELFAQQYKRFMDSLLAFAPSWPNYLTRGTVPVITQKIDDWYAPISDRFWKWAKTLPGYDAMALYQMTMISKLILEN